MDWLAAGPRDSVEEGGGLMKFRNGFFEELLSSAPVIAVVNEARDRVADRARASAPVGDTGDYKDGIVTSGKMQKRYVGLVIASDPKSLIVEARTGNLARAVRGSARGR